MAERILYVDDDPNLLGMYKVQLEQWFQVTTAQGGEEGLEALSQQSYAVVISDLNMPGMNGIEFLAKVREFDPDIVRLMLTAKADLQSAIDAVNRSKIYRLLTKPCSSGDLKGHLEDAVAQFRLLRSERDLLSKTLSGAVKVLTEILASVNPDAFGRVGAVRQLVRLMCEELHPPDPWQIELAAMLSHIAFIGVPHAVLARASQPLALSPADLQVLQSHSKVGAALISNIPRLDGVARIVAHQHHHFESRRDACNDVHGEQIPIGARILKVALEYDALICSGLQADAALSVIRRREGAYDPAAVGALRKITSASEGQDDCSPSEDSEPCAVQLCG